MKKHFVWLITLACIFGLAQAEKKAGPAPETHKAYNPGGENWMAAPPALPSGAQLAVLEGDPSQPVEFTMRLKMPGGYKIPPHSHPRTEHVTVISGAFKVGMGDKFDTSQGMTLSPGTFAWIKPDMHHFAWSEGETVIQLHGQGPWEINYVNPDDDPRRKK